MAFRESSDSLDKKFMTRALRLARQGLGRSSPNPAVGAVVVQRGRVVGEGFHALAGTPHGEALALSRAGAKAKGATLYVTLEPCHHQGRTPPCTRAILAAGVRRVVFGAADPNPRVKGGGGAFLDQKGIQVERCLIERCEEEHRFFFTHITQKRPHVILKTAATLDGKTASRTGHSRWVTGEDSRRLVHRMRNWWDAICVGSGTALSDDPQLTCRAPGGRDPLRVIVDTSLKLSPTAKVINPESIAGCLIACGPRPPVKERRALETAGAEVLCLAKQKGKVDLNALLSELGARGVTSLLLEGGAGLAWGFMAAGLVDEVMYFYAPKLIGGKDAPPMVGGKGFAAMDQALMLARPRVRRLGDDILMTAKVMR